MHDDRTKDSEPSDDALAPDRSQHEDPVPAARQRDRGRDAEKPSKIPRRGWWDIALRVKEEVAADNLGLVAAGVAFYAFLGMFPTLIAIVSIYGIAADPGDVTRQVEGFSRILPSSVQQLLNEQMVRLTQQEGGALGWGTALGIVGAIWSAARGVKALMKGLNIAYDETEERGFIGTNLVGLGLTGGIILGVVLALAGIVGVPTVLAAIGMEGVWGTVAGIIRWPLLAVVALGILAVLYRWGPDRRNARWRWVTPGAWLAAVVWLAASAGFSLFVQNFNSYDNTYGPIAAIVVLMLWLMLSAFVVLLGAELNAEMEHQTARDTTTSGGKPMGERGAYVADTLGKSRAGRDEG